MKELIQRLDELYAKATPGEWTKEPPKGEIGGFSSGVLIAVTAPSKRNRIYADPPGGSFPAADQELIIALHNAYPDLRAALERMQNVCEAADAVYRRIAPLATRDQRLSMLELGDALFALDHEQPARIGTGGA